MITIQDLSAKIKQSTLDEKAQNALIALLLKLSKKQIEEIAKIIDIDIQKQESIFAQAQLKADMFEKEFFDNLKKEIKELQKEERQDKLSALEVNFNQWKTNSQSPIMTTDAN